MAITYTLAAQLIPQPADSSYAYVYPFPNGLHRGDGSASQAGDVLSVQPDGSFQVRPPDAIGPWETATLDGVVLRYAHDGKLFLVVPQ